MSSLSTNFGFQLADGTDDFNNDTYIKGNFQTIDANVLKKSQTVKTPSALQMETLVVTFSASGSANYVQQSFTFANTYANPPVVVPGNITQPESYVDAMDYPYIFSVTKTGGTVKMSVAGGTNNFGAGNIVLNLLVVGS